MCSALCRPWSELDNVDLIVFLCSQDSEEFLGNAAKKAKIDNGSKIPEVDETQSSEQTEAEA